MINICVQNTYINLFHDDFHAIIVFKDTYINLFHDDFHAIIVFKDYIY